MRVAPGRFCCLLGPRGPWPRLPTRRSVRFSKYGATPHLRGERGRFRCVLGIQSRRSSYPGPGTVLIGRFGGCPQLRSKGGQLHRLLGSERFWTGHPTPGDAGGTGHGHRNANRAARHSNTKAYADANRAARHSNTKAYADATPIRMEILRVRGGRDHQHQEVWVEDLRPNGGVRPACQFILGSVLDPACSGKTFEAYTN